MLFILGIVILVSIHKDMQHIKKDVGQYKNNLDQHINKQKEANQQSLKNFISFDKRISKTDESLAFLLNALGQVNDVGGLKNIRSTLVIKPNKEKP